MLGATGSAIRGMAERENSGCPTTRRRQSDLHFFAERSFASVVDLSILPFPVKKVYNQTEDGCKEDIYIQGTTEKIDMGSKC